MKIFVLSISFVLSLLCNLFLHAQNIEFDESNFSNQQKELKKAQKNIEKGDKYFREEPSEYLLALEPYLEANRFNPDNALLNYKIGICYLNSIEKIKAIPYLEKALTLNKNVSTDINYLLGQAYHLNFEFDKATDKYHEYKASLPVDGITKLIDQIDKKLNECKIGKELMDKPVNVYIENIGNIVNSVYPDYNPVINADETMMMFTSCRDNTTGGGLAEDLTYFEDIYISYKKDTGNWETPINPRRPLNTEFNDAVIGLSPDGQKLFVFKGDNGGDIYECKLDGDKWLKPEKLNDNINTIYKESSASFSYDGRTIYFVSKREGGYGGSDIYMSKMNANGEWGTAINLGSTINTSYDEEGVFMHPDGKTLYFSSKGHRTMGGYDIFKSVFQDNKWSEPENLGFPINTPDDDVFFSVTANGVHGYYSSTKLGGEGKHDIYVVIFVEKANQLTLLKGLTLDEITLEPVKASIEITDNEKNEIVATFESNSKTGKYLVSLPFGRNYGIAVKAENYLFHSENFDITSATEFREVNKDIMLKKIEVGKKTILKNIFFDFGRATLRPESTAELKMLRDYLNNNPNITIEISGHTDNVGSAKLNQNLSEDRAKVVVDYLIREGINKNRLQYKGYGYSQPVATNDTEEGRQLNRRTEFKILSK